MAHEQKVISTYTVHCFDDLEEALTWLRDIQGADAQLVSMMSNTNIAVWATEIDCTFDGKQYTVNMLLDILKNKDAKALKKIHPIYFQNLRKAALQKEDTSFLAENLTLKQIAALPNITLGSFDVEDLKVMKDRAEQGPTIYHERVYTLKKDNPEEQTVFVCVKEFTVVELLKRKSIYASRYGRKELDKKTVEPIDFRKEYATVEQVASYLGINVQYFFMTKRYNAENEVYKYLGEVEYVDGQKVFRTENLKTLLRESYHPVNEAYKNQEDRYVPADGVYMREELPAMFGVASTVSRKSVTHAVAIGKLSYFDINPRCIRVSKRDFKEYIDERVDDENRDLGFISKVMDREIIQFPKKATQEQKDQIMQNYLDEETFLGIIALTDNGLWKSPKNYFQNTLWVSLNDYSKLYLNRGDGKLYRKKEEVANWLNAFYKIKDKDYKEVPIDIDVLVKYKNEDTDGVGGLCPMTHFTEWASAKYPDVDPEDFRRKVMYWIQNGFIPALVFSKRMKYLYLPDLIGSDRFENYMKK